MSEDPLETKLRELESNLKESDYEIGQLKKRNNQLENTIEELEDIIETREDMIMELEAIKDLENGANTESKKIQAAESRFIFELEERDRYIRDLKNRMGMLRKDYTQLQQKYEKFKNSHRESSVIRVEDLRKKKPLNALIADLQDKVNKQKSVINSLENQLKEAADFNQKLKEKDEIIEVYKSEINDLNQKIKEISSSSQDPGRDSITRNLLEDLQEKLNKSKVQIINLKQKLSKYEKKSKKLEKEEQSSIIKKIKEELEVKDEKIELMENEINSMNIGKISIDIEHNDSVPSRIVKTLQEELQNKLNKSKLEVKSLQKEINRLKSGTTPLEGESQKEIEKKLQMQQEMVIFLQKQLETKDGEIETIKNEAVQIKKRYRQLENQLKVKDRKINELQKQIGTQPFQNPTQFQEDPPLNLKLKELKGIIADLEKENIEQKLEIRQLRKK